MAKRSSIFVCQDCGCRSPKWLGRCPECGEWNSYVEERIEESGSPKQGWVGIEGPRVEPRRFDELGERTAPRLSCGIPGFDTVLGGGMVPGSLLLLAGEPGAGKSTLLLQVAAYVSNRGSVLYTSGEESPQQIKMRGDRLGLEPRELLLHNETRLEGILESFEKVSPSMLIVDSVQTVYSARFSSAPGSVSQVREAAARLLLLAKAAGVPIFLVGHVTKGGLIAGPKTMEHIVDAVIMLEGERFHSLRTLRALKNRFGPVSEMGVFEMRHDGLREVANPSELFLEERAAGVSGSVVTAAVEGSRTLLIEVQALVSPSAYGPGRRTAEGFDQNRLALLLAVLERRGGLEIGARDVYVNVVGGVRLDEPAADLAVAAAVASSFLDKPLPERAVLVGELGLGGEIRSVAAAELRCREAAALSMSEIYLPKQNAKKIGKFENLSLRPVRSINQLFEELFT